MESIRKNKIFTKIFKQTGATMNSVANLAQGKINTEYVIKEIKTADKELKSFLFTLGCYEGESVTLISELADNYVIAVKDARYSIDRELAEAISI